MNDDLYTEYWQEQALRYAMFMNDESEDAAFVAETAAHPEVLDQPWIHDLKELYRNHDDPDIRSQMTPLDKLQEYRNEHFVSLVYQKATPDILRHHCDNILARQLPIAKSLSTPDQFAHTREKLIERAPSIIKKISNSRFENETTYFNEYVRCTQFDCFVDNTLDETYPPNAEFLETLRESVRLVTENDPRGRKGTAARLNVESFATNFNDQTRGDLKKLNSEAVSMTQQLITANKFPVDFLDEALKFLAAEDKPKPPPPELN